MATEKEKDPKTKSKYGIAKSAVIGLAVAAAVSALTWFGVFRKNDLFLLDRQYVHRPKIAVDTTIVTIDIDDPSVEQIGRWPWTWDRHAVILDMLKLYDGRQVALVEPYFSEPGPVTVQKDQARQIAMSVAQFAQGGADVDYRGEVEGLIPDYNERLLRMVERFPRTFVGNSFSIPEGEAAQDPEKIRRMTDSYKIHFSLAKKESVASLDTFSILWPSPRSLLKAVDIVPVTAGLSKRIAGAGFTRIIQDIDGIVRRTPLLVWYDGRAHPSIALSMAARFFDCPLERIRIEPGRYIELAGDSTTVRIPIDKNANMLVNWAGGYTDVFTHLPYNLIAYFYAHHLAKIYVNQFQIGTDNPSDVFQKVHQYLMRQRLVLPDDAQLMAKQYTYIWIMDYLTDRGAPYQAFLNGTQEESAEEYLYWWNQLSVNKRTEEFLKAGQTPDIQAVLFSLDIKDTDIEKFRDGFNQTAFFFAAGRIHRMKPLFFKEPEGVNVSGEIMRFTPMSLTGRTVFVGLTATGLNAFNPTPYQQRYQMFGLIPNIYNTIVTRQFLRAQSAWVQYLYILIYALSVTWIVLHFRPLMGFLVVLVTAGLHLGVAWTLFIAAGIIMPIVPPVLTALLCYVAANLYRYVEEQRERQKVRGLFGAMVSPEVLRMMEENPDKFALGGEKHEATMFSSDVSGFTTISEGVTAQELADILNIYLTPMSNIIMNFDGFVDKYEGDAIKADYGVPITDPHHAWKGCLSALLQQEELKVIQRLLLLKYGVKITARMGVNTGIIAAGNMGSEKRMQYTVMGDAVTLAEELEPINKLYESWIAIGPLTYEKSREHVEVRHLDRVIMGPGGHAVDVYELMGWKRDKFMDHWSRRPVPPLFLEGWRKLTPEKILGYIHYWNERNFPETPFYKDLRALFGQLEPLAVGSVKSHDIAAVLTLRTDLDDLDRAIQSYDNLLAGMTLDRVCQGELDEFRQHCDKAADDWLKILWGWKVKLKEHQFSVQHLSDKIPADNFEELLRLVDTYQKRVECYIKRISFPKPDDTIGYGFAEHLKGLLVDGKGGPSHEEATAKKEEHLKAIRTLVEQFLEKLQKRAPEFHEFLADHCTVPEYRFRVRDAFDEARKPYLKQDWDAAETGFKKVLEIDPRDGPAIKYIERIAHLRKHPPAKDWNGDWAEE